MSNHDDLREVVKKARERGATMTVIAVRRVWSRRTTFGQRVRIRGSLCARYLGPTADGKKTLVDLDVEEAARWIESQDRRSS